MHYRVSGLLLGLLAAAAVLGLGYLGLLAVQAHNRSFQAASYRRGERALQALALPPGVVDMTDTKAGGAPFGCRPAADTRCLHARLATKDVDPLLHELLTVTHDECTSELVQCTVFGRIGGHGAFAIAFPHVNATKNGHVPAGAVLARNGRQYVLGTDITLGLTDPANP